MNGFPFVVLIIVLCIIMWAQGKDQKKIANAKNQRAQRHTGNEVMRWLELNPEASMDEIVRKTKDIELQQPYIARTVLKMTAKNLDNMTRQYPKDTETQEYLIIVTDSTGTTVTDIVYVDLATLFPLDVYIV